MGIFNKLKNIFYDEVVVDEDESEELEKVKKISKKEAKEVDETPKIEEVKYKTIELNEEPVKKTENTFDERELFRSERTFNFVDFPDEEEEKLPPRRNVLNDQNRNTKLQDPVSTESPKVFKPTPVISPIWGVLDKDYKKDEIKTKTLSNDNLSSSLTTYDTVRRKAYGTLEDELEDTLNSMNKVTTDTINKEIDKVDKDVELLEEKTAKIEDLINKIDAASNEVDPELSVGDLEDQFEMEEEEEAKEAEKETNTDDTVSDNTLEHDLFNLIDSMYDKEE